MIHYVPIIESLKTLVEDKTFIEAVRCNRNRMHTRKEVISDVLDGRAYRENTFSRIILVLMLDICIVMV